jgi:hypothetical protein
VIEVILTGFRCGATGISLNDLKIDKGVNMNKLSPDETDLEVILTGSRCGATGISLNDLKIDKGVNMNKLSPDIYF